MLKNVHFHNVRKFTWGKKRQQFAIDHILCKIHIYFQQITENLAKYILKLFNTKYSKLRDF